MPRKTLAGAKRMVAAIVEARRRSEVVARIVSRTGVLIIDVMPIERAARRISKERIFDVAFLSAMRPPR